MKKVKLNAASIKKKGSPVVNMMGVAVGSGGSSGAIDAYTKQQSDAKYQPKGNYLTEHQSLEGYAKLADIPTIPLNISDFYNDSGYVKDIDLFKVIYSESGSVESYADIKNVVQHWKSRLYFSFGDQIEVQTSGSFGNLQFDVVDFNNVHKEHDSSESSMNLMLHDVINGYEINAVQAMIACPNGLASGLYHFHLPYNYESWVAGDYEFRISQDVPAGGQLKLSNEVGGGTPIDSLSLLMYASPKSTTVMESVPIVYAAGGIDLGSMGDMQPHNGVYLNHWNRICYGSNNYEQSAIDQWLNGSGSDWWNPACMFDRPPSYVDQPGFLGQLDSGFVDALADVIVKCNTNIVYESPDAPHPVNTAYEIKRKIYIPSEVEVLRSAGSMYADGSKPYALYSRKSPKSQKIKYDHENKNTAVNWWLRSPGIGSGNDGAVCNTSGDLGIFSAYFEAGLVPACTIA